MIKPIAQLSLAFILLMFVQGCSEEQSPKTVEKIRPAKLITVEDASVQRVFTFPAVIEAAKSVELTFQIAGKVNELNVLESDLVESGDTIAQLDQSDAISQLSQAKAEYDNANTEYQRAEKLYSQDAISRSLLDSRRTRKDVTRAALDKVEKAFRDTTLLAPFSGRVSRVLIRQFQNVQAKEPVVLLQSNEIEAVINVPSAIVTRARQIENVNARIILDSIPDEHIVATFTEFAGEADQATQTYSVSLSFEPPQNLLVLPGMTATVELDLLFTDDSGVVQSGIAVPLSSILSEGDTKYVWLVTEDQRIQKQAVELQPNLSDTVTVVDGLSSGDTIVAAGVDFFFEGMKVRPWMPK
ncbi:MAG: efflux RND transporter periplasmic adaptor subunit [Gammaproteobacteria bacterium]|nr:efflux RND transporter periplasmic adaptor subunit [Gammaproteobacteria bacterium]MCY4219002.1 efflux RND transporter periplasmic adaptor subunit [Gammaproteobacteria bacterium]